MVSSVGAEKNLYCQKVRMIGFDPTKRGENEKNEKEEHRWVVGVRSAYRYSFFLFIDILYFSSTCRRVNSNIREYQKIGSLGSQNP